MKSTSIEEGVKRFLVDNGFKYIRLIENSTSHSVTKLKMTWTFARNSTFYLQTLTMNQYLENYSFQLLDVQVFIFDVKNDNIITFLHEIAHAPVRSSVIYIKYVWTQSEETYLKRTLMELKLDLLFYLAVSSDDGVKWYQIVTLKSGYTMTQLKFSLDTFQMIEDYNLEGLTIQSISTNDAPYLTIENCDQGGKQCKTDGYLKDYTDVIAQKLNFTHESHIQIDGDWGNVPKSGPYNRSGEWGGVMGKIVDAEYDMSVSVWWWLRERYEMMSFVIIISYDELLVWKTTNLEIDFGLFVRPFSTQSWVAILSLFAIATICIFLNQYVIPHTEDSNGEKILVATLWYFFVILYAFYGGAMTMFFTKAQHIVFQDTEDVLRAYPEWKPVFFYSDLPKFALKAAYDPEYAKFWAQIQSTLQETTIYSIEEGLRLIAVEKRVMLIDDNKVNGYLASNPTYGKRMQSVVTKKNIPLCLAFPFNSPLKQMFRKAILHARQSGVEANLIKKWMRRANINDNMMVENVVFSTEQLILAFVFFMSALSFSFVILCAELSISRTSYLIYSLLYNIGKIVCNK
jgi:hypothetical protein